jgi:hypothetical protein
VCQTITELPPAERQLIRELADYEANTLDEVALHCTPG